ncbi:hypothetical protein BBJ28_00013048 [Nothophytophthora sp. Chile5]|nr:hypothetical protein BBJ28_00013048 [Nothophytophthora sp. Chile5]
MAESTATEALLRQQFALLDASFCFLAKHRAVPSVRSVLRMANSFGGAQISLSDLQQLAAIAPELLAIERSDAVGSGQQQRTGTTCSSHASPLDWRRRFRLHAYMALCSPVSCHTEDVFRPTPAAPGDQEIVTFPLVPQTSKRASTKRKSLFDAALKALAERPASGLQTPIVSPESPTDPPVSETLPQLKETALDQSSDNNWGSSVLQLLQQMDCYRGQIVHVERRRARAARYRDIAALDLPPRVWEALKKCHIEQLYSHQFEAIDAIRRGENAVLSTSTASGKSLAYNVPMLDMLLDDPKSTFLYLFPTKALAQDQSKSLRRFLAAAELPLHLGATFVRTLEPTVFALDGDTPMKSRSMVIRETRVFLTNPDMLHLTILPQHMHWKRVLSSLRLIVVDEAHMYRGVFGSHVACVFRRLFRLCALFGSNPQVVCCSATIQNPGAHFRRLLPSLPPPPTNSATETVPDSRQNELAPPNLHFFRQRPLKVITEDGAPTGEKLFCVWNPKGGASTVDAEHTPTRKANSKRSLAKERQSTAAVDSETPPTTRSSRKRKLAEATTQESTASPIKSSSSTSPIFQSAQILSRLMEAQVATLLFCRGRKLTELVLMNVHSILGANSATRRLISRVSSYRGGYTLEARRRIEQRLFNGDLLGVVATNALELGIDVGELDCTIHLGLPSSVASLWQQAGRAGRRQQHDKQKQSIAIIVCFDAPLDQHFAQKRHAAELFQLQPEAVSLNPANNRVLAQHLLCAARESALSSRSGMNYIDSYIFGNLADSDRIGAQQAETTEVRAMLQSLVKDQKLMVTSEIDGHVRYGIHPCMPKKFRAVSLRSICEITYKVVVIGNAVNYDASNCEELDEVPGDRAFFQLYPTAVYLHQAQEYLIMRLDNVQHVAFAKKCPQQLKHFTTCRDYTELDVVRVQEATRLGSNSEKQEAEGPVLVRVGVVSILTRVFGSSMLEKRTMRVLGTNEFALPPMQSFGDAVWLELPASLQEQVEAEGGTSSWRAALHGVGHLCVAVARLFVLCDATDIDTEHVNPFEQRNRYALLHQCHP